MRRIDTIVVGGGQAGRASDLLHGVAADVERAVDRLLDAVPGVGR